jgi:hypothetical protein
VGNPATGKTRYPALDPTNSSCVDRRTASASRRLPVCSEEPAPGPAEKAGAQIDQAVETAGQKTEAALDKAGNYTGEKLDEAGEAMEHAGEQLKQ